MLSGLEKINFHKGDFAQAITDVDRVVVEFHSSSSTLEAVFHKGAAGY